MIASAGVPSGAIGVAPLVTAVFPAFTTNNPAGPLIVTGVPEPVAVAPKGNALTKATKPEAISAAVPVASEVKDTGRVSTNPVKVFTPVTLMA